MKSENPHTMRVCGAVGTQSGTILHSEKALFEGLFENLIVEISCDEVAAVRLENGMLFEIARAVFL